MVLELGSHIIDIGTLPGVDGKDHSLSNYQNKDILAVFFSCNHCPYVVGSEKEMIALQEEYGPKGIQLISISSNDPITYPQDSFEYMKKRAIEKNFNFPYLFDESQEIAKKYGATRTPEFYIYNKQRKLVYKGRINDNPKNPNQTNRHDVKEAFESLLSGKAIELPETNALGCSIKWKS